MRLILVCLLVVAIITSCSTGPRYRPSDPVGRAMTTGTASSDRSAKAVPAIMPTASSPCSDSLYIALSHRKLESLTEREYTYFMQKDKDCTEYRRVAMQTNLQAEPGRQTAQAIEHASNTWLTVAIIGLIVGGAIATVATIQSEPW